MLVIIALMSGTVFAQTQRADYTGSLDDRVTEMVYTFSMRAGESVVISADATSGDLDTMLELRDPDRKVVADNDDRNPFSLDSALGYTAVVGGNYEVTITRYARSEGDTSGTYALRIEVGDESVLRLLKAFSKVAFSGPERVMDTTHFRIHYTVEGNDAVTPAYIQAVADTMEEVWHIQIDQIGWPAPPDDGEEGGNSRFDVYLMDLIDDTGDGPLGTTAGIGSVGDNPNTPTIEEYAISSVMRIENDFAESQQNDRDPISLMRATAAHEFHHAIQHGYDYGDAHTWYHESTSSWMETITFPKDEDASVYVPYNFEYPELCFGTDSDPDGQLMYGDWLFMQSLADVYGNGVIKRLWENISQNEGFDSLTATLREHGDTIPAALARYRIQNLMRNYKFAPDFEAASVWLEGTISRVGRQDFTGVQELGANYVALTMPPGTYSVRLVNDSSDMLEMWTVQVTGTQAQS
ncbi:MAG: PPC domain-containing protein, partial [Anaerolineae bacterium]|nr:PPC domain-containing protein [Anaerolineae bacterium]